MVVCSILAPHRLPGDLPRNLGGFVAAKYIIDLSQEERDAALAVIHAPKEKARRRTRARILIAATAGLANKDIARCLSTSTSTVFRVRRKFVEGGLEHALSEKSLSGDTQN
jgi:FixJ family two-component response regulator